MITLAIILATLGMLVLPLGRLFVTYRKRKGDAYFTVESNVKKFTMIRRIVSLVLVITALIILHFQ